MLIYREAFRCAVGGHVEQAPILASLLCLGTPLNSPTISGAYIVAASWRWSGELLSPALGGVSVQLMANF